VTAFAIRDARPEDMSALREVFRRSSLSNEGDRMTLLAHPDALELPDLAVKEGRTRTAVADGRIIGFATWLSAGNAIEIEDLFVDPEWMRQGAGRALVLDLIAIARGSGIRRVEVTANQHALAFYEKVGFVVGHDAQTRFGPAPRMHLEVNATRTRCGRWTPVDGHLADRLHAYAARATTSRSRPGSVPSWPPLG
jgi:GNAT superfamily N-acetyltransferase